MARVNPNRLLVEGKEQRVLPFVMDKHVVWGDRKEEWVVEIKGFGGVDTLLKPGVIEAESKTSGLKALGIIVDANDHFDSRWHQIRERWPREFGALPDALPSDGLIQQGPKGPRVGVWIMPDNRSRGMLETFLGELIKPELATLWDFAKESCDASRARGATYKDGRNPLSAMPRVSCTVGLAPSPHGARGTPPTGR
jgi:hypothetical protein